MQITRLSGALLICILSLSFLSVVSLFSPLARAALIWGDGFESGDHVAWDTETGTVDVTTLHPFTGTYSANVTATSNSNDEHYLSQAASGYTALWFSCHYYFDTLSFAAANDMLTIMWINTNGPKGIQLLLQKYAYTGSGYAWRIHYIDSGDSMAIETTPPNPGDYYGLELSWNHSAPNTGVAFWVNGTDVFDTIYPDGYSTQTSTVGLGSKDYTGSSAFTYKGFFDDGVYGDAYLGCPGVTGAGSDTDPPAFLDGNPYLETQTQNWNTSLAGELCSVSMNATDNVGLSGYLLSYTTDVNRTVWQNNTWRATSGKNTLITDNFTVPIPSTLTWRISAVFYANDTNDNWGVSLGVWPETVLEIGPVINGTQINTLTPTGYGSGNKAGSRRVFHGTGYWVAFYEYDQRIYAVTSPDGNTWTEQGEVNSASGEMLSEDSTAWAPYVWGSQLYCAYANGTYSAGENSTWGFFKLGTLHSDGSITWGVSLRLDYWFRTLIGSCWPGGPGSPGLIFGYWSFSFTEALDGSGLWFGFRVTGGFTGYYDRIFMGWISSSGTLTPKVIGYSSSATYYDTEQFSVVTDPSFDTGFLLLWRAHDDGYVHYGRYTGSAWLQVRYPEISAYTYYLGSGSDWSTAYVPYLSRTYACLKDVGTFYFSDVPDRTGRFVADSLTVTNTDINIGHNDNNVEIVAAAGSVLYLYTKLNNSAWDGGEVKVKALNDFTGLSFTEDFGVSDQAGILWGNISEYMSSYDVLFSTWGSGRFSLELTLDLEGCGNWVFVNERYYNWTLSVTHSINASMVNLAQLGFYVNTRQGPVFNTLSYDGTNWTVAYDPANITEYNIMPVRTQASTASYSVDWLTATFMFKIYFTQDSLDEYLNGWDVKARATDTDAYDTGWNTLISHGFKIYNKGGFSMNSTAGAVGPGTWSAGVNTARTPFSFWAENNSWASNDLYYRDLVHLKMQPSIVALLGRATFYVTYGVDYCIQGDSVEWVTGLKVILGAVAVTIGSERWWNWTVSWFFQGVFVRQDYVMAFERAGIHWVPYEDSSLVAETKLWIDVWFDAGNGSTVVAGRVSAYEWPMENNAPELIRYLNSAWGPIDDQPTSSECFEPITASDNVTIEPSAKIKMIKYWSSVEVAADDEDQLVYVLDFNVWDLTFSQTPFPPLSGIQTPVFQPPLFPDMPGGGFFGALFSGFSYIGKMLGDNALFGGLGLWTNFVGFLDTVASWFGAPGAFSNFITWLSAQLGFLWTGLSYVGSLFLSIFTFLASIMDYLIALLAQAVLTFANIISTMASMLTGAYGTGANLWNALGIWNWVVLGLIMYPMYLFILWDAEGPDAVYGQLMFIFNIGNMLVHYLISFIQMVIGVIHTLVESIPVVE